MGPAIPTVAARRFEGIVFDWDDIGVPDRHADTTRIRRLLEQACEVEKVGILLSLSLHKPRWRGTGERRKLDAIFMTARSSGWWRGRSICRWRASWPAATRSSARGSVTPARRSRKHSWSYARSRTASIHKPSGAGDSLAHSNYSPHATPKESPFSTRAPTGSRQKSKPRSATAAPKPSKTPSNTPDPMRTSRSGSTPRQTTSTSTYATTDQASTPQPPTTASDSKTCTTASEPSAATSRSRPNSLNRGRLWHDRGTASSA
jgi:hypothetical protein